MSRETNSKSHQGKTKRDKASGAWARRYANQQARADWQNDSKRREKGLADFPWFACNGQKNRPLKRAMKIA